MYHYICKYTNKKKGLRNEAPFQPKQNSKYHRMKARNKGIKIRKTCGHNGFKQNPKFSILYINY